MGDQGSGERLLWPPTAKGILWDKALDIYEVNGNSAADVALN